MCSFIGYSMINDNEKEILNSNHDHDHEGGFDEPVFVEFEDENHNVIRCEVIDGFEYKGKNYCVVYNNEDGSSYVFKLTDEDELVVPEEKEFEEVAAYYDSIVDED